MGLGWGLKYDQKNESNAMEKMSFDIIYKEYRRDGTDSEGRSL
jgi:hypothetical protein